jgi:pimeloyl-ACP methyl ester carboxylesterase
MKTKYYFLGLMVVLLISCNKRLDGFLFNNAQIDAYLLDDYAGEKPFDLDASYNIPSDLVHLFSYPINDNGKTLLVYAIYIGDVNTINQDTVFLYCHGNRDHMDFYWNRQKLLAHVGGKNRYGVLSFDYPGFGMSEGTPTEENMYLATAGALDWLQNKGMVNNRLIAYGYSLGSAPATRIAANPNEFSLCPKILILENPFASSEEMAQSSSGLSFPGSYFTNIKIANAEEIKKVNQPFLWMHGTYDTFLTLEYHGQVVFDNYTGIRGKSVIVDGATHDGLLGVPMVMGIQNYLHTLLDFITE